MWQIPLSLSQTMAGSTASTKAPAFRALWASVFLRQFAGFRLRQAITTSLRFLGLTARHALALDLAISVFLRYQALDLSAWVKVRTGHRTQVRP
jgi:hypothetical protein